MAVRMTSGWLLAAAVLCGALVGSGCAQETAAEENVGFKSAACPAFKAGHCAHSYCYASSKPGFQYKFETILLKSNEDGDAVQVWAQLPPGVTTPSKQAGTQSDCCWRCAQTSGCEYWQWIPYLEAPCYMVTSGIDKSCQLPTATYDTAMEADTRRVYIGGKCNPSAAVSNDPHFEGAHGTKYDFNGLPDRSFCLISDKQVHVNIKLAGYLDNRTEGATVLKDGMAIRTWIKEIGLLWKEGVEEHKIHLVARDGKLQKGNGFLKSISVDGQAMVLPKVGGSLAGPGSLELKFEGLEKTGKFDVDYYTLKIGDTVDLDLRMRVAHPMLQTAKEAEAHFNIGINNIKQTERIHGLLGQTYRADHEQRAIDYSQISAMMHSPIAADGESGKGFLDGLPHDYISSSVLSHDCLFSAYETVTSVASD